VHETPAAAAVFHLRLLSVPALVRVMAMLPTALTGLIGSRVKVTETTLPRCGISPICAPHVRYGLAQSLL